MLHRIEGYWKWFILIQIAVIILLSVVGLPKDNWSMCWWLGIIGVDSVITHPIFYEEEG